MGFPPQHPSVLLPVIPSQYIKEKALVVGFHDCGIARVSALPEFQNHLSLWLEKGGHAQMLFMSRNQDLRSNPALLVPGARSVISLLLSYKPSQTMPTNPRIAQYAYGEDYHLTVKQFLFHLIATIREDYPTFEAKPCVDSVPISDKQWAVQAGLGWQGKHSLLVSSRYGSLCFLAELVTPSEVDRYDQPIENQCGNCRKCVDACPNQALQISDHGTYLLADRCTSYNTIENRAPLLPDSLHTNGYVFGCDCCQQVCPYNQHAPVCQNISDQRLQLLAQLPESDEPSFKAFAKNSPLSRIKYPQWLRNLRHQEKEPTKNTNK